MKQQSVYLHTKKELGLVHNILKEEGMEIIFKSPCVDLHFWDLTSEEKASFMEILAEDLSRSLKGLESVDKDEKNLVKKLKSFKDESVEFGKLLRSNPTNFKTNEKYESLNKMRLAYSRQVEKGSIFSYMRMRSYDFLFPGKTQYSVLIAKKGTEIVRYLSFRQDPVLTITGPKAAKLKSSLESKF